MELAFANHWYIKYDMTSNSTEYIKIDKTYNSYMPYWDTIDCYEYIDEYLIEETTNECTNRDVYGLFNPSKSSKTLKEIPYYIGDIYMNVFTWIIIGILILILIGMFAYNCLN